MSYIPNNIDGINPAPAIQMPAERFDPTIHKMSQEDALEQVSLLRDHKFHEIGSAELHSGIHPAYGKCIISIYEAHASLIPFA